ncbi:MAG: DUF4465 domain-containing protein [Bacteroidaceae bacterium]|nr:DUF4465 domain-containing protein [Bacteroidaceae bacterium]
MKKVLSFALMALAMGFVFTSCDNGKEDDVKSYTLSVSLSKADSVYLATDTTNKAGYYFRKDIIIDPFSLVHSFSSWGFAMGFTYTSGTDKTTPGYMNLSAITGKGVKTNAYFTVNTGGAMYGLPAEISFKDGKAYNVKECYVTNSTYAYLAIKNHDDGNGEYTMIKEWTKDDKFTLTITGYNGREKTASVEFVLANGTDIVDSWQQVDLSKLGTVTKIDFSLTSTDNGQWGMNTPSYFCLDQLKVTE